jgi:short-subunit dehydrogenase
MKTAVITGASSGVGELTAKRLSQAGYNVVLSARRENLLNDVASACREYGVEAIVVAADISKKEDVERIAASAIQRFGGFDVWINNAGVIAYGRFMDFSTEEFRQVIETNLFGCVYGAREALTQFRAQGYGNLVNVASGFGAIPSPFVSPYVASKFAVRGFSAVLREEMAADNIRDIHVCTVLPATMDTPVYANGANKMGHKVTPLPPVLDPSKATDAIMEVIDHPKAEILVGKAMKVPILLFNALPTGFINLFARYVKTYGYKKDESAEVSAGNLFVPSQNKGIRGGWKREGSRNKLLFLPLFAAGIAVLLASKKQRSQS